MGRILGGATTHPSHALHAPLAHRTHPQLAQVWKVHVGASVLPHYRSESRRRLDDVALNDRLVPFSSRRTRYHIPLYRLVPPPPRMVIDATAHRVPLRYRRGDLCPHLLGDRPTPLRQKRRARSSDIRRSSLAGTRGSHHRLHKVSRGRPEHVCPCDIDGSACVGGPAYNGNYGMHWANRGVAYNV